MDIPEGYEEIQAFGEFFSFDEVGKSLQGTYKGVEEIEGQYGKQTYWQILDKEETLYLVPENVKMERYKAVLEEGDKIIILYEGLAVSRTGNEYKEFKIYRENKPF